MNKGIIGKRVEYKQSMHSSTEQGIVMCLCENNLWFLICDDELELHRVRYDMVSRIVLDMKFKKVKKEKIEE
jgi:hypothetical protein